MKPEGSSELKIPVSEIENGKQGKSWKINPKKKKKTRSCFRGFCIASIIIIVIFISGIGGGIYYIRTALNAPGGSETDMVKFSVEPGDGVARIATNLRKQKLIKNSLLFQYYVWQKGVGGFLQAGEYTLRQSMTMEEISGVLSGGKISVEGQVVLLEGWTADEFADALGDKMFLSKSAYLDLVHHPHEHFNDYDFVRDLPEDATLEGFLFPDTYRFESLSTEEVVIRKLLSNFGGRVDYSLREEISRQGRTLHDVIILASIVEKEAKLFDDKKIVAGIFQKRLELERRLESDATINYILGTENLQPSIDDTRTPSPYNTYLNYGLPVGPISNPGLESIMAAIYPEETEYLYFISRLDTGEMIYSKTFEEHQENKAKYLD